MLIWNRSRRLRARRALVILALGLIGSVATLGVTEPWREEGVSDAREASAPNGGSLHRLPFPEGARYEVLQSFSGPYGHVDETEFAVDFKMPIGSAVAASRSGVVIKVVENFPNAEPRKPEPGNENYVVVDHQDGTFGRYYHLDQDGAEVSVGDVVGQGQPIGRSGNSGASFGPHLHFDVTSGCSEWGCQTVTFRFDDVEEDPLIAGEIYPRDQD